MSLETFLLCFRWSADVHTSLSSSQSAAQQRGGLCCFKVKICERSYQEDVNYKITRGSETMTEPSVLPFASRWTRSWSSSTTTRVTTVRESASVRSRSTSTGPAWPETWPAGSTAATPAWTEPRGSGSAAASTTAPTAAARWSAAWASPSTGTSTAVTVRGTCLYSSFRCIFTRHLVQVSSSQHGPADPVVEGCWSSELAPSAPLVYLFDPFHRGLFRPQRGQSRPRCGRRAHAPGARRLGCKTQQLLTAHQIIR